MITVDSPQGPSQVSHCWACDVGVRSEIGASPPDYVLLRGALQIVSRLSHVGGLGLFATVFLLLVCAGPERVAAVAVAGEANARSGLAVTALIAACTLVGTVLAGNTAMAPREPRSEEPSAWSLSDAEASAVAKKLSAALQIQTVSFEQQGKTSTDLSKLLELHALLRRLFPLVHQRLEVHLVNKYSLLFVWASKEGDAAGLAPVMLCAHLDVVPVDASDRPQWRQDPFSGHVDSDGVIWGRGAVDNKHNVIGQLEAVERLLAKGAVPARTLLLACGHDEELGGDQGAQFLAAEIKRRFGRVELILDEGMFLIKKVLPVKDDKAIAFVGTVEKGSISVELTVDACPPGHSSIPPFESNVGILSKAIHRLESIPHRPFLQDYLAKLEHIAYALPLPLRVVLTNGWLFRPWITKMMLSQPALAASLRTTTAVTMTQAGIKINVVPGRAQAWVNHRIHPNDKDAMTVLANDAAIVSDERVKIAQYSQDLYRPPSPETSTDSKAFKFVARCIRKVYDNVPVMPAVMIANTDTRWYWELSDNIMRHSPVLMESLDDVKMFHGNNERITTKQLAQVVTFYTQLIASLGEIR